MKYPLFMCAFRIDYIKNILFGNSNLVDWNPEAVLSEDCLSYTVSLEDLYKKLLDSEVNELLSGGLPLFKEDTRYIESRKYLLGSSYEKRWESYCLEGVGAIKKIDLLDVPEGFSVNSDVYLLSTLEKELHFRFVDIPANFKRSYTKIKTSIKGDLIYVTEILVWEDLGVCTL